MRSRNSAGILLRTGRPKLSALSKVIGWSCVQVPWDRSRASSSNFSCGILSAKSSRTLSRTWAIAQVRESVRELLADKIPQEKLEELARLLSQGTWTHDHPITFERAESFGLPVRSNIPAEFLVLMSLYPQPVRHQPTVEYLPIPRRLKGVRPQ